MSLLKKSALVVALALVAGLPVGAANAVPVLQLYVEGSTYDTTHESWVFQPNTGDPIRLWVIGNVSGPGSKGTIEGVKISIVYDDPGSDVQITLAPSTTGGHGGVVDPSTPSAISGPSQIVDDGSRPLLYDGKPLSPHGVYGAGVEWQEFLLGDFALSDSHIGDFISVFPTDLVANGGQINVYELTIVGEVTDLHIDAYNHVEAGNHAKAVFAPYSHDAGTGVNEPVPVSEPGTLGLFLAGILSLAGLAWSGRGNLKVAH